MSNDEPKKIVIDMVGVMEKMTPEMMDHARDIMIEGLIKGGKEHKDRADKAEANCAILREALTHCINNSDRPTLIEELAIRALGDTA